MERARDRSFGHSVDQVCSRQYALEGNGGEHAEI